MRVPKFGRLSDAGEHFLDEGLSAKTGFDRHDEEQINLTEVRDNFFQGGSGF
jgi:hypothetical protein